MEKIPAAQCLNIDKATCEEAKDYTKRKYVFRLHLKDGAEFLFVAPDQTEMKEWLEKLQYWAGMFALSSFTCFHEYACHFWHPPPREL